MKVTVAKKKENALVGRTEYDLALEFDGKTPSKSEMRDAIIQGVGCNPDTTILKRTNSSFGARKVTARVNVYKTKEDMMRLEPDYALIRNRFKEAVAKAKKAAPAKKKE
jgi:small subunit ribosomal protein S24e